MNYLIGDLSDIVRVSKRTLQHYDKIGLLKPATINDAGYRIYNEHSVDQLQQILFYKELGFSLKKIIEILNSPNFDLLASLQFQEKIANEKMRQYDQMIRTIRQTQKAIEGEIQMSAKEKFNGSLFDQNPYEEEAKQLFGEKAIRDSKIKMAQFSSIELQNLWQQQFKKLSKLRNSKPNSPEVLKEMDSFFKFLNQHFGNYSKEAFAGLGMLYVQDERFTKNIDQYGNGLAQFLQIAMQAYSSK
ncbi:transcriptional regulator [Kurthia zopfii]|uniref:DNA-binding transcriptional MerR regulator n=1 Tax=Kurthia zopfii TaxID=1650 RepID=A0A2U3AF58_9BACL|nr:MerR family transcriptional regulator [Kurthia zopfii]PWI23160.1 MerR family transcriptional regulator [Kurthia zopfii]TDR41340.1 DNA-binding transcriptional MerR regulator [Kurthia zopfii]STX09845.1 Multidrug transporter activation protein [Kurthia zopfii]VEI07248.1 Multidrug transporter activation protein [Kurthia zopfii]GEK29982.1 transcriptional regulator [Kurthia zopfii]